MAARMFQALLSSRRRRRQLTAMVGITLCVWLASILYLALATPSYMARMVVGPAQSSTASGNALAAAATRFGGLSSGALDLFGSDEGDAVEDFVQLSRSVRLAQHLIDNYRLTQLIFDQEWTGQDWQPPGGIKAGLKHLLFSAFGRESWTPPDAHRLSAYINRNVVFRKIPDTNYYSVFLTDPNRDRAVALLQAMYETGDQMLREAGRESTAAQVAYLSEQMRRTNDVEQLAVYRRLLSENISRLALMEIDQPFAVRLFDPPSAARQPAAPSISTVLAAALLLGPLLAVGLVVLVSWAFPERAGRPGERPARSASGFRRAPPLRAAGDDDSNAA